MLKPRGIRSCANARGQGIARVLRYVGDRARQHADSTKAIVGGQANFGFLMGGDPYPTFRSMEKASCCSY
jgi:hypothetical protein